MDKIKTIKKLKLLIRFLFTAACSCLILLPIYFIVINSLKTVEESRYLSFSLPASFQWSNYIEVIKAGSLIRAFGNSMLMAGGSVIICIVTGSMASYALSRRKTKLNNFLYVYFFLGLIAPVNYVTTLFTLKFLHLQNTYPGIILEFGTLGIPFLVFLYYGFYEGIPRELDEAAVIDGCSPFQLFFKVIFPLLKPATITGFVLNFLGAWNDFVTPLYLLSDNKKLGMTNSIYNFFGEHFNDWNMIFADIILTIAPILIIYLCGQKYIVSGTAGAVKG
ncbi:carbohydrate ABC transporter permease [Murimonas intestini]|uniref:Raffinose/stachyose/melibiose transport system permease protein n=1 Tax=Murimonas intestini TaxID=1337051 RepID=A0AB73T4R2_9FIRM|nr:carbohydrate ABC transporter permease [Murimonas intestini]MCR1840905.1 carbohydrate ABC transporter permease [Murimonas intestini]MCR1865976.1 carbohydrate ABC transporter permease [Murimonas intestini]MCR1883396.1 carbohydrate ABC transporter permease [Murimonas intestini]